MPATAPPCTPARIAIVADAKGGDFNGMSHSGTWLFLRNTGTRACSLPGLPLVRLFDRAGRALPASRRAPPGMHPGPVIVPVTIGAGDRVRTGLRWVSGVVYDHSRCLTAARVSVAVGSGRATTRLAGHLCGPAGGPVTFDQSVLEPVADYPAE